MRKNAKPQVRYFYIAQKEYKLGKTKRKRAIAFSTRDAYYTIRWLLNNSDSWESLYKKLGEHTIFTEEKEIFNLYREKYPNWNDLNIIAVINER